MSMSIPLSHLRDRNIEVLPHEAVAIAQQLIFGDADVSNARATFGPLCSETVGIDPEGRVHCCGCAATASASEVAIFLQQLLRSSGTRVPGGLRYALGRALHDVDAPPFDSAAAFGTALARFERGDRRDVLKMLFVRAADAMSDRHAPGQAGPPERRRGGPSASALRRELREADQHLYEARLATLRSSARDTSRGASRVAPMIACVVSGVALITAGDFLARADTGLTMPRSSPTAALTMRDPLHPYARVVPLPPVPEERVLAPDAAQPVPAALRRQRHERIDWAKAVAASQASAERARLAKPEPSSPDGAVRIKFEWNNPFGRAH